MFCGGSLSDYARGLNATVSCEGAVNKVRLAFSDLRSLCWVSIWLTKTRLAVDN